MKLFLLIYFTILVTYLSCKKYPFYETPEIRRHDSPLKQNFNPRIANINKSTKPSPYTGSNPRNDLIRKFSLRNIDKWITSVDKLNLDKVVDKVIVDNISNIRTVATKLKEKIHHICSKMTERMKLLDMKLKEIKVVEDKMYHLKSGKFKASLKRLKSKSRKLKLSLKKEKKLVKKILKSVMKKQEKILRVLSVFDKEFTKKNHESLKRMLTAINVSLKSYMKYPFFKKVYHEFITLFLNKVKGFSKKKFKNPEEAANQFVRKYWKKFFKNEEKKNSLKEKEIMVKKHNKKLKKKVIN